MENNVEIYDYTKQGVDYSPFIVDLESPIEQPDPILIQTDTGIPMLFRRNISTIAASAKVGKTFLMSGIATAMFKDNGFMNMHSPVEKPKVLFIDTEMDMSDTQELTQRVHIS